MKASPIDPTVIERIRQAIVESQATDGAHWSWACHRFADWRGQIDAEMALNYERIPNFAMRVREFLAGALEHHVIADDSIELAPETGTGPLACWYGWMGEFKEDCAEEYANSMRRLLQAAPIECWLAVCGGDEPDDQEGNIILSLDNPFFLVFLGHVMDFYERNLAHRGEER